MLVGVVMTSKDTLLMRHAEVIMQAEFLYLVCPHVAATCWVPLYCPLLMQMRPSHWKAMQHKNAPLLLHSEQYCPD